MQTTQPTHRDMNTTPCIACKEQIHEHAKLCPFCRSSQQRAPISVTLQIMKWVGGVTALISLIMAVVSMNAYFGDWLEKKELVNEWIQAARIQQASGDYPQALGLLEEALKLEPFSRKARNASVQIAMALIRTKRAWQKDVKDTVNKLLPILARSAANPDVQMSADIKAHIGWAYVLITEATYKKYSIDTYFEKALQQDYTNVYAHAFWGYWILSQNNDNTYQGHRYQKAFDHFDTAAKGKKERQFVRYLQVTALLNSSTKESLCEAFKVAVQMKEENETPTDYIRYKLIELYDRLGSDYPLDASLTQAVLKQFDAKKMLDIFKWLYAELDAKNSPGNVDFERYHFVAAYLTAADNEKEIALDLLKSLKLKLRDSSRYHLDIDREIQKIQAASAGTE